MRFEVRTAIHDFNGDQTYTEKRKHDLTPSATFAVIRRGSPRQRDDYPIWRSALA